MCTKNPTEMGFFPLVQHRMGPSTPSPLPPRSPHLAPPAADVYVVAWAAALTPGLQG